MTKTDDILTPFDYRGGRVEPRTVNADGTVSGVTIGTDRPCGDGPFRVRRASVRAWRARAAEEKRATQ